MLIYRSDMYLYKYIHTKMKHWLNNRNEQTKVMQNMGSHPNMSKCTECNLLVEDTTSKAGCVSKISTIWDMIWTMPTYQNQIIWGCCWYISSNRRVKIATTNVIKCGYVCIYIYMHRMYRYMNELDQQSWDTWETGRQNAMHIT